MTTALKRLLLLARAQEAEKAAADLHDPEAIERAWWLTERARELVADLDDNLIPEEVAPA